MRDVLGELVKAWRLGEPAALATVTATWSSAPRQPGAAMVVHADGVVAGSVSGGCVEGAVYELCREVAGSGVPRTARFGITDDDAFEVGLPCGGTIELFVEPAGFPELGVLAGEVAAGRPVALLTGVEGRAGRHLVLTAAGRHGSLGHDRLDDAATDDGRGLLAAGRSGLLHYGPDGQRRGTGATVLVTSFAPPARMLVFGATDHAAAVARIGSFLGYRVTVCDARPVFATAKRFPEADEVVVDWPHRYLAAEAGAGRLDARTVACVLTHDTKFDVPVLEVALRLPIAYIGAMGSRRTHDDRLKRLRETGLTETEIARLSSPIGLDLGARTPEETAVSVAAEIVALRWQGSGERLTATSGPIHGIS
ncbi:XdhC family protein [Winogradskya consettensis]|uniref:Xanthine dehydrogenase accessory factor n=1 Tax=Winogradskya consettensis TaxID=113560 RepID=A0A919T294_9ACTN|nr:XdhC/CoxI family protein [Actinoplanes consettensis]GIM84261.1 xanthine dehydrogenase accessory factor [Actinoplanes consettensis]